MGGGRRVGGTGAKAELLCSIGFVALERAGLSNVGLGEGRAAAFGVAAPSTYA